MTNSWINEKNHGLPADVFDCICPHCNKGYFYDTTHTPHCDHRFCACKEMGYLV